MNKKFPVSGEFISDFINQCAIDGAVMPAEIIAAAEQEIAQIQKLLDDANQKLIRQIKLKHVVRILGVCTSNNKKTLIRPTIGTETNKLLEELSLRICNFIENNEGCTVPEIISGVASYSQHEAVITSIKHLMSNGIINRDNEKTFYMGENWERRND